MPNDTIEDRLETVREVRDWDGEGEDPVEDVDWLTRDRVEREEATGKRCRGPKLQDAEALADRLYAEERDELLRLVAGIVAGVRDSGFDLAELAERDRPVGVEAKAVETLDEAREIVAGVRDVDQLIALLFRALDPETGARYSGPSGNEAAGEIHDVARRGCGFDINELVLAFPADGRRRREECPGCGRTVTFRTPDDLEV